MTMMGMGMLAVSVRKIKALTRRLERMKLNGIGRQNQDMLCVLRV
jgi:hypothetical protein